jgi:AcrR family transcriptional regulator
MNTEQNKLEDRILVEAENLFLEQGFSKTTTAQIAKKVGCNQALVHYYYRTKDKLFDNIFERKLKELLENIDSCIQNTENLNFEEQIKHIITTHFDFVCSNSQLVPFIVTELLNNHERFRRLFENSAKSRNDLFNSFEHKVEEQVKAGRINSIRPVDLLITMFSLNVSSFMLASTVQKSLNVPPQFLKEKLEHRKEEIIKTVLARLKK